jgi:outer membrane protein OmpA-like peptidoglycan-associated protein
MKRNKSLKITIEGHTNGCNSGIAFSQRLSYARAQTVYNFLIEHQINLQRIQYKGYGCKHLLHAVGGPNQHLNRRVQIEIIEL